MRGYMVNGNCGSPICKAPKPRRRNKQPERALHANVGQMLAWLKPKCICIPYPAGATDLGQKMGAILKGQYKIKSGVSDWLFMWGLPYCDGPGMAMLNVTGIHHEPNAFSTCGAIELKAGKGEQSHDQKIFEMDCKLLGIPYRLARSVDEVVMILEEWGRLAPGTRDRIRGFSPK